MVDLFYLLNSNTVIVFIDGRVFIYFIRHKVIIHPYTTLIHKYKIDTKQTINKICIHNERKKSNHSNKK